MIKESVDKAILEKLTFSATCQRPQCRRQDMNKVYYIRPVSPDFRMLWRGWKQLL